MDETEACLEAKHASPWQAVAALNGLSNLLLSHSSQSSHLCQFGSPSRRCCCPAVISCCSVCALPGLNAIGGRPTGVDTVASFSSDRSLPSIAGKQLKVARFGREPRLELSCTCLQVSCLKTETTEAALSRRLAEQYLVVQDPARHNTLYKTALKVGHCMTGAGAACTGLILSIRDTRDTCTRMLAGGEQAFATSAILAYECGYSEDSLRGQLQQEVSQLTSSYPTMQVSPLSHV